MSHGRHRKGKGEKGRGERKKRKKTSFRKSPRPSGLESSEPSWWPEIKSRVAAPSPRNAKTYGPSSSNSEFPGTWLRKVAPARCVQAPTLACEVLLTGEGHSTDRARSAKSKPRVLYFSGVTSSGGLKLRTLLSWSKCVHNTMPLSDSQSLMFNLFGALVSLVFPLEFWISL